MDWTTACPDWRERIAAGRSLVPCGVLFRDEAEASMDVFNSLRIVDAAGEPTFGETSRPWITDFAESIFGSYDAETGKRLIREFFCLISKKNGKSTLAAGIMLTALIRNWRRSAEFLIVAPTIEVANNSFKPAMDMVLASETLSNFLKPNAHYRTIEHDKTGAVLKVVAADRDTVTGKKATGVLIDELWLFGKRENADAMLREVTGGLVSRPEGFVIYLSTQSDEPPSGVFKEKLNYFRKVRDGDIEDRKSLGVLYEFPKAMVDAKEHLKPENWRMTNPNLGISVDQDWLEDEFRKAEMAGTAQLKVHCSKHLNFEIGQALKDDAWAGAEYWEDASEPGLTLEALLDRSEVATIGIDGGGLDDLLGFAVAGREKGTRRWLVWCRAWAHPIVLKRRKEIAEQLKDFAKDGDLVFCASPTQDVSEVADLCLQVKASGLLPESASIGVDKLGLPGLVEALLSAGFTTVDDGGEITGISQGGFLNPAILGAERRLSDGTMVHADQPLMAWAVGNAKVEMKSSSRAITKQTAGSAKIDPLIAMFNAVMLMSRNPEASSMNLDDFLSAPVVA